MSELIFIILFFGTPGILGFVMARRVRKNPFVWGAICAIFPFILIVLTTQDRTLIGYLLSRKQNIIGIMLMTVGTLGGLFVSQRKSPVTTSFGQVFTMTPAQETTCFAVGSAVLFVLGLIVLGLAIKRNKPVI